MLQQITGLGEGSNKYLKDLLLFVGNEEIAIERLR
jgi:hypothetical protein